MCRKNGSAEGGCFRDVFFRSGSDQFGRDGGMERQTFFRITVEQPALGFEIEFLILLAEHADAVVFAEFREEIISQETIIASGSLAVGIAERDQGNGDA